jgi:hypothetical protein
MHTELIEDLLDEVRVAVLKLDRIACALEQAVSAPTYVDQYGNYRQPKPPCLPDIWLARQLERGRSE